MPLSKIQSEVLRLLAAHRDPESYVGGATPLNRSAPRFSEDIDVFHDREGRKLVASSTILEMEQALACDIPAHGPMLRKLKHAPPGPHVL